MKLGGIVVAVALVAGGGTAGTSASEPATEVLPADTVAAVSDVPAGLGTINKAEFQRALAQRAAAGGRIPTPKPGGNGYEGLEHAAMEDRLEAVWLQGQALEMGISVTPRRVARDLAQIKKQAFESAAEYRRFLREAHLTPRDVKERVKLQLLGVRILASIERGVTGKANKTAALRKFVAEYLERWRARTICASGFILDFCSNGPLPPR